jgi:transcriptional regulator with XRE-family HTH domain
MSFGRTLQKLREEAGLSQSQLAYKSGTSIDSLRNWEQDRALPRIDAVTRLAKALGVSMDQLAYAESRARKPPKKK